MEINDRIELLIGKLGYNPHSFTKTLGIKSTSTIPNLLRERERKPSYEVLNRIASRFPTINMNWLLTGSGEIFPPKVDDIPRIQDRIKRVMEFYRLDRGDIVTRTGSHPQVLNDILDNDQEPSEEFLDVFARAFPNISEDWLFMNRGRMFKSVIYDKDSENGSPNLEGIPLYDVEFTPNGAKIGRAISMMRIHGFGDCDLAVRCITKQMDPEILPGDYCLCKTTSTDMILYGERYIMTVKSQYRLSYIDQGKNEKEVILRPPNGSKNPPVAVKKDDISMIWLVKGVIKRFV